MTDCIYSTGNKCASAAPCRVPFSGLLQSLRYELFFPATSKLPSHKRRREGPATSQHDRGLLALTHTLSSSPPEENTSLTSHRPRVKSYLSCGRCCRYGLILDGCFQVLRFETSPRSFTSSKKKAGNYVYKGGFLPR